MFTSSTKREIKHFHVVVVQQRLRNVQKSVMHVLSCFANQTRCLFAVAVVVAYVPFPVDQAVIVVHVKQHR